MDMKRVAALAMACLMVACLLPAAAPSDAAVEGDYESQLDANGAKVYTALGERFATSQSNPTAELAFTVAFDSPELFSTEEEARAYASETVWSALAARYYTTPEYIWLWDLPVMDIGLTSTVSVATVSGSGSQYHLVSSVSFILSVPSDMRDDPETAENEISGYIAAVRDAYFEVSGDLGQKVEAIATGLSSVNVVDDAEGEVSNIHDALVSRSSSSAGIAAAFTTLCAYNNVGPALTVRGHVSSSFEGEAPVGYWNIVQDDGSWYAVDVTMDSEDDRTALLAGYSTTVASNGERFGSTHVADAGMGDSSLTVPQIAMTGYSWPDDRSFIDRYGIYIIVVLIAAIMGAVLIHASRNGNI